jgi:hypothetical protein
MLPKLSDAREGEGREVQSPHRRARLPASTDDMSKQPGTLQLGMRAWTFIGNPAVVASIEAEDGKLHDPVFRRVFL